MGAIGRETGFMMKKDWFFWPLGPIFRWMGNSKTIINTGGILTMDLSTLVKMSNTYGSNPAYVLAGGGNTSVKDDTTLYVKGSGTQLATIKAEEFVEMSRTRLNEIMKTDYPEDDVKRESLYLADVMAAVTDADKTKRPSVEALLHNLFAYTYVLHVHPWLLQDHFGYPELPDSLP